MPVTRPPAPRPRRIPIKVEMELASRARATRAIPRKPGPRTRGELIADIHRYLTAAKTPAERDARFWQMRKRHGMDTLRKVLTDPALSAAYQDANKTGRKPPHRTLAGMLWNSLNLAKRQNPTAVRRRLLQFKERFGRGVTVRMSEDSRFREFQGLQPEHNLALPLVKLSQAQKEEIIATWRRNTDVAATARLRSTNEIPLNAGDVKQVLVQAGVYKPKTRRDPNAAYWASLTEPQIGQLVKKHGLYPAEERVLLELAAGGNPYEIANRLGTSMDGFRQAKLRLRRKLGLGRVRPTKK